MRICESSASTCDGENEETIMLEKLTTAAKRRVAIVVKQQIDRLALTPPPPGVMVEETADGLTLTGKRLRRRMLTDPKLRNFGR